MVSLHHQMELLVNLVVLRLSPRSQIKVRLVIAVVSERAVHPAFALLLAQRLEKKKKCDSGHLRAQLVLLF